jgi:hypothetical protein
MATVKRMAVSCAVWCRKPRGKKLTLVKLRLENGLRVLPAETPPELIVARCLEAFVREHPGLVAQKIEIWRGDFVGEETQSQAHRWWFAVTIES